MLCNDNESESTTFVGYHNIIISPGMTAIYGQNPGFTLFELDSDNQAISDVRMIFLPIEKTYNMNTDYAQAR